MLNTIPAFLILSTYLSIFFTHLSIHLSIVWNYLSIAWKYNSLQSCAGRRFLNKPAFRKRQRGFCTEPWQFLNCKQHTTRSENNCISSENWSCSWYSCLCSCSWYICIQLYVIYMYTASAICDIYVYSVSYMWYMYMYTAICDIYVYSWYI